MKLSYEKPEVEFTDFDILDVVTGSIDLGGGVGGGGSVEDGGGWGEEEED